MITSQGKINKERIQVISDAIAKGNYISTACQLSGISIGTYENWLKAGKELLDSNTVPLENEAGYLYCEFYNSVKTAEAQAESKAVGHVQDAMPKNWLAAMTWLERKFPEKWGRRDAVDINFSKGIEFLERVSKALQRPQAEAIEAQEKPLLLT